VFKKFLEYTSLLLIVTIFIGLGLWQLDRARSLKEILNAQKDGDGVVKDWEVALLQVDTTDAILVVRGLWSERLQEPQLSMSNRVELEGILRAHQSEDRAFNSPGVISRLDSSVIVSLTDLDLYDGYVIALDEKVREGVIERTRVTPELRTARIPGFYWQHISYVVVWWLMAAVVLYLPLYRRRVAA